MNTVEEIAIIGIGAHYPGALDIQTLWEILYQEGNSLEDFLKRDFH